MHSEYWVAKFPALFPIVPALPQLFGSLWAVCVNPRSLRKLHNDLKLDNCMFDPAKPDRILASFGRNRLIDLLDHKVAPANAN